MDGYDDILKNIGHIYGKDIKNIVTNWVVIILIGGLIVLPSLYAWFNIKASWDPYGQTDQIPIGVVNLDKGAKTHGEEIDAGKEIVKELKKNDSMDWKFVDYDKAMDKVDYGDYFAAIVIPKDFSKNLASVTDGKPKKANVDYYVNEKINAIAPKITSKGADVIVDDISSNFVSTVNGVIFDIFNQIGIEMEKDLPDIERFEKYVFDIEKRLPDIHKTLKSSLNDAEDADGLIAKAENEIPRVEKATKNGLEIVDDTLGYLDEGEKKLKEISPKIKTDLKKARQLTNEANNALKKLQNIDIDFSKGDDIVQKIENDMNSSVTKMKNTEETIQKLKQQAAQLKEQLPDEQEVPTDESNDKDNQDEDSNQQSNAEKKKQIEAQNEAIRKTKEKISEQEKTLEEAEQGLKTLREAIEDVNVNAKDIQDFTKDKKKEIDQKVSQLQKKTEETTVQLDTFIKEYSERIEPTVFEQITKAKNTLNDARTTLVNVQNMIPKVKKILASTKENLHDGKDVLQDALKEYPYVNEKIGEVADKIRDAQDETDIETIIELLKNDPESEKGFFAEPVKLTEHELYPIPNYGSGMTPFYTTLALWVGALLLISLVSVEVRHDRIYTSQEEYFGRYLTFLTIGFFQSLIVTLGDIFILDVYIKEPIWFVVFGLIIVVVFMSIVYTLVSVFGDVGKAMAIILLVLQIAGSGGTYPVVLLPEFFQKIHPFLPFTYGVELMREAVGGIVWEKAINSMLMLGLFAVIFFLIGIFLKKPINKRQEVLMKKSKESGLFH